MRVRIYVLQTGWPRWSMGAGTGSARQGQQSPRSLRAPRHAPPPATRPAVSTSPLQRAAAAAPRPCMCLPPRGACSRPALPAPSGSRHALRIAARAQQRSIWAALARGRSSRVATGVLQAQFLQCPRSAAAAHGAARRLGALMHALARCRMAHVQQGWWSKQWQHVALALQASSVPMALHACRTPVRHPERCQRGLTRRRMCAS